jgi:sugar O-acyltransferase (sialic acid O-acetyltransferase NeuD family)
LTRKRIVILGAGGMAREIRWLLGEINSIAERYEFLGYVVSDLTGSGRFDSRAEILGDYAWLEANRHSIDAVTIGIGTPAARLKVGREMDQILPAAERPVLIHPSVIFDLASATIGPGAQICAGTVATVNLTLGPLALCNFGCTVGHEAEVGAGTVINPGANISGGVVLGAGVLIGTGAKVLQYCRVGDGAVVGAGAVVLSDVPSRTTVAGVPARSIVRGRLMAGTG